MRNFAEAMSSLEVNTSHRLIMFKVLGDIEEAGFNPPNSDFGSCLLLLECYV